MKPKKFDDIATAPSRSVQVYNILLGVAFHRQTITYKQLASIVGFEGAGVFSTILDHILHWCSANKLPPLTVLVVNSSTGLPGAGFHSSDDLHKAREQVYSERWYQLVPPTSEELEEAYRAYKQAAKP